MTTRLTGSGNLGGRPRGSKNRATLSEEFIAALLRSFRRKGERAIDRVASTQPTNFLKLVAGLVPREHRIEQTDWISSMTNEELADAIQALKAFIAAEPARRAELIDQAPVVDIPDRSSQQMVEIARAVRRPRRSRQPKAEDIV